jgi:hypothetical protein
VRREARNLSVAAIRLFAALFRRELGKVMTPVWVINGCTFCTDLHRAVARSARAGMPGSWPLSTLGIGSDGFCELRA